MCLNVSIFHDNLSDAGGYSLVKTLPYNVGLAPRLSLSLCPREAAGSPVGRAAQE